MTMPLTERDGVTDNDPSPAGAETLGRAPRETRPAYPDHWERAGATPKSATPARGRGLSTAGCDLTYNCAHWPRPRRPPGNPLRDGEPGDSPHAAHNRPRPEEDAPYIHPNG